MSSLRPSPLALPSLLLAGPGRLRQDNPNFCDGVDCTAPDAPIDSPPVTCNGNGPDTSCPADNPVCVSGACTGACTSDTDCVGRPAGELICHAGSGDCVTCDEDDRQAEPGSAEEDCPGTNNSVCDADTHTCRACEAHAECFSGVCDAGTCAPVANVIYMSADGTDGGNNCDDRANGCLTLQFAIEPAHRHPQVHPHGAERDALPCPQPQQPGGLQRRRGYVIGTGAEVRRVNDGEIIDIRGGSTVTIEGLLVSVATNAGSGAGVSIDDSTVDIAAGSHPGQRVSRHQRHRGTSNVRLVRSVLSGNRRGGYFQSGGAFALVNNVIVGNGDPLLGFRIRRHQHRERYWRRQPPRVQHRGAELCAGDDG